MDSLALAVVNSPRLTFPEGVTPNVQLILRWIHFSAGIVWVGMLYFFILVNNAFMKEIDASVRSRIVPPLMSRALWWFRWGALLTVFVGIWYWMMIVAADARSAHTTGGHAIGTFFMIWTAAFVIEMGLLMSPAEVLKKGPVFGVIVGVVVIAAAYLYLSLNSHGWESNRLLAIGIGGGLGWFMLLNVWGIVWRAQKKIIRWTLESTTKGAAMPAQAAQLARVALLTARTNFVLSFPMLLFMAIASHYPVFGPIT
jgi:uncharacterized membrane protein